MLLPLLALVTSTPEFNFQAAAQPLPKLVAALSAATSRPLVVSEGMAGQIAFMDVRKTTDTEALEQLAVACGGRWQADKGKDVLVRDEARRATMQAAGFAQRERELADELKELGDSFATPDSKAKDEEDSQSGDEEDPLSYQVLSRIGPRRLATMDEGDRIVFSTHPLARQTGFDDAEDLIEAFIQRRNEGNQRQLEGALEGLEENERGPDGAREKALRDYYKPVTTWSKANFIITRPFLGDNDLEVFMTLYDANGIELAEDKGALAMEGTDNAPPDIKDAKPTFATLHLGRAATDLARYYVKTRQDYSDYMHAEVGPITELRSRVEARLRKPEQVDPLAYSADYVEKLAEHDGRNVVGCLPDSFISFLPDEFGLDKLEALRGALQEREDLVVTEKGKWLTLSPSDLRLVNTPRSRLTALAPRLATLKDPTIEQQEALATDGFGDSNQDGVSQLSLLLDPGVSSDLQSLDWEFLRFYAMLSTEQKAALRQRKRLSFADLSPDQRDVLDRYIYGAYTSWTEDRPGMLTIDVPTNDEENTGSDGAEITQNGYRYQPPLDYRLEPTEVAPDGLPQGGYLALEESTNDGLSPIYKNRPDAANSRFISGGLMAAALEIASELASSSFFAPPPNTPQPVGFDYVRIGKEHAMAFRIYMSNDSYHPANVAEHTFGPGSTYALGHLPAEIQGIYDQTYQTVFKQLSEAMKGFNTNGGGGVP